MRTTQHAPTNAGGVPRWHARYRAAVSADVAGNDVLLYHQVENLSLGGACVATPVPDAVGSRVDVTLDLRDGAAPMRVAAEVMWAERGASGRMGLRWSGITPAQSRRLGARLARAAGRAISHPGDARERPRA